MAWRHVSHAPPCAICSSPDWCSYTDDESALICRRLEDPKQGAIHQVDKHGGHYWLYLSRSATGRPAAVQEVEPSSFKLEVADTATLDRVYRLFLDKLPKLEALHRGDLEKRGYSSADIEALQFRSWPRSRVDLISIGKSLLKECGPDTLFSVPGFTLIEYKYLVCEHCQKDECQNTIQCKKVTKTGHRMGVAWDTFSGYAIPVRDLYGRIVSIHLRSDEDKPTHRYVTFASSVAERPFGCTSPAGYRAADRAWTAAVRAPSRPATRSIGNTLGHARRRLRQRGGPRSSKRGRARGVQSIPDR